MRFISKFVALLLVLLSLLASHSAHAFKPASEKWGHTMITKGVLEDGGYSFGGLEVPQFKYSVGGNDLFVSSYANHWIVNGVQSRDFFGYSATDNVTFGSNEDWFFTICDSGAVYRNARSSTPDGELVRWDAPGGCFLVTADLSDGDGHFDNDNILGSTKAIRAHTYYAIDLAKRVVTESTEPKQSLYAARMMLGKAIHTLQDFYAHSNWAETHRTVSELFTPMTDYLNGSIGQESVFFSPIGLYRGAQPMPPKDATSTSATTPYRGYQSDDACEAKMDAVGNSWVTNDGNWNLTREYSEETFGQIFVTTGAWWNGTYTFGGNGGAAGSDRSSHVRCDHGSAVSLTVGGVGDIGHVMGIAKDAPWMPLANHGPQDLSGRDDHANIADDHGMEALYADFGKNVIADWSTYLHRIASYFAAEHTRLYLNKVVELVKSNHPDQANDILEVLFGGAVVVASDRARVFVIDRSGTMYDTLPSIVSSIKSNMVDGHTYGLVDFADANDMTDLRIGSKANISSLLDQLQARGGGGCTTPVFKALNKALTGALAKEIKNMDVLYFTDAFSSDSAEFVATNVDLVKKLNATITGVVSGSCSPLDPAYQQMSQATNSPLLIIEPSADGVAAAMTAVAAANNNGRLVYVEDGTISNAHIIDVPVETGATALTFRVTQTTGTVTILQPNGQALVGGSGVVFSSSALLNGQIVTVPNPATGIWKISLAPGVGGATYFAQAQLSNPIDFLGLEFFSTMQMGRPGHVYQPMLPPQGQAGLVSTKATIPGGASNVQLQLLDFGGNLLGSYPLSKSTDSMFEGDITLPSVAYRARVLGRGSSGQVFSRMLPTTQTAPLARVAGRLTVTPTTSFWAPGNRYTFYLLVTNLGGDDTVAISSPGLGGASVTFDSTSLSIAGSSQAVVTGSILFPQYVTGNLVVNVLSQSGATFSLNLPIDLRPMLTVNSSAGAGGRIWPDYAQPTPRGDRRTFTLIPDVGVAVAGVTGCGGSLVGNVFTTATITESCEVKAQFSGTTYPYPETATISVIKYGSGRGAVTSSPAGIDCGSTCSASYLAGQTVTLQASPAPGYTFKGWTGACSGSSNSCSVAMNGTQSVTATFGGVGPSDPVIPLLTIGAACGLQEWPQIVDLSGGEGPAVVAALVNSLTNALGMPLRFADQSACGTVTLTGFNGGKLAFVPLAFQSGDTRADGIYSVGDGQYKVVRSGKSLVIAPAVVHLEQLAALVPGVVASQGDNGVIVASYNGVTYVVQPGVAVQLDDPKGGTRLIVGGDGLLHFMDAAGNNQVLYPAFAQPATVRGILQGMDPSATLNIDLNGSATITFQGQRYALVPDLTLGNIPSGRAGQPWWQESATRYRLVNVQPVGSTQGFTVLP